MTRLVSMWLTCDPFMLRGELTLTLRFLWFGSTAGLSSGLLTEGRSVTSELVLMNPRRRRRRHTCMSSSSQEAALQRETAENNSAELQNSASCSSARTKRQSVSTRLKLSSTITPSPLIPTPSMHPQQAKA